jgi:hypothetical protein
MSSLPFATHLHEGEEEKRALRGRHEGCNRRCAYEMELLNVKSKLSLSNLIIIPDTSHTNSTLPGTVFSTRLLNICEISLFLFGKKHRMLVSIPSNAIRSSRPQISGNSMCRVHTPHSTQHFQPPQASTKKLHVMND